MGLLDWLTGRTRPEPGVAPASRDEVIAAMLALNSPDLSWRVRDVRGEAPGTLAAGLEALQLTHAPELIAEWKSDEPRWRDALAADGLSANYRVLLRLDGDAREVREVDHDGAATVMATSGGIGVALGTQRGRIWQQGASASFKRDADGKWVREGGDGFSTDDIKGPLRDAATSRGWGWRSVAFARF